ncbi:hypothetical protein PH5382_01528 [Phaeobacter sp. CECT 5382]|uniref:DUF4405 domain-containing protein n=1 Tax=Phaeobacter sp. CECT 5382 TaxID=1712645 RepID=UPI0006DAADFA|nr:DUF4405 domain-containing protein [Phaeobacter sp. CECT 5382]CUH87599.1 hypothetical protein PH5382_01528 [Phaeobacter sp. CECT 5382]
MSSLRKWATPLTVASFLIMGVTGILMFFHLDSGLNVPLHEWAGWLMVLGVAAHLVLNWRPFSTYLKRPAARAIMALGAVVLALSFWPVAGGGNPAQKVMQAMALSDVGTVIALSGQDVTTGLEQLAAAGLVADETTSIASLTGGDRGRQMQVIEVLFPDP